MRAFLFFIVTASPLAQTAGQSSPVIQPGERIRILSPSYTYEGTVVQLYPDTLVVEPDGWGEEVRVALTSLTRIDVRSGRNWARGAGMGAMIGATLGGVGGVLVAVFAEPGVDFVKVVALTLGGGGGLGAVVGATTSAVRWKDSGVTGPDARAPRVRRAGVHFRIASIRF